MRTVRLALLVLMALAVLGGLAAGQVTAPDATPAASPAAGALSAVAPLFSDESSDGVKLSAALEIALLLTILSVLPALVITVTSFTRIVIVL
ncbi:MAG: flagellar biosynthetic protein FliP, partial [Planctomycetes bacterium]|nr:flagellar biosynthetic protein FliP [Planctomycetota bacterium]